METGDVLVALDDLLASWGEAFTHSRRKALEELLAQLKVLAGDLLASEALYRSITQSIDEIVRAQGGKQALFNAHFTIDYPDDGPPTIPSSTIHTLAKGFKNVARIGNWSLTGIRLVVAATLFSMPRAVTAATAPGIELAVLGSIAQASPASTIVAGGESVSRASRFALMAKLGKWAETLGTVASVAGFVVLVVESVLGAIEIAAMRRQSTEFRENIELLRKGVTDVEAAFAEAEQLLGELYASYATDGSAGMILAAQGASVDLGAFRKDLLRLPTLITGEAAGHNSFVALRSTLIQRNASARAIILDTIKQDVLSLQGWTTQVELACRMLDEGLPAEKTAKLANIPLDLAQRLKPHVEQTAEPDKYAPRFKIALDGTVALA